MTDFAEHYEKFGKAAIEILFREKPDKYVFLAASFMPKEIDVTHTENKLNDLPDEKIDALFDFIRRRGDIINTIRQATVGSIRAIERREDAETDEFKLNYYRPLSEAARVHYHWRSLPRRTPNGGKPEWQDARQCH